MKVHLLVTKVLEFGDIVKRVDLVFHVKFVQNSLNFSVQALKIKKIHQEKISYTSGNENAEKTFLYFSQKKVALIFQEVTFRTQKSKISHTFLCKEAKFSKSKYFLLTKTSHFSSFYNIFFYTQQTFVSHLLTDF